MGSSPSQIASLFQQLVKLGKATTARFNAVYVIALDAFQSSMMPANPTLESTILANDLPTMSLLTSPPTSSTDLLHALTLSASLSRPLAFSHLLTQHPSLTDSLYDRSLLLLALGDANVPIWRIILAHKPGAKDRHFGHHGTVVERCVQSGYIELLKYLLGEGARVERTDKPIMLRAMVCEASEEMKELLIRYGATTNFSEEQAEWAEYCSQQKAEGNAS